MPNRLTRRELGLAGASVTFSPACAAADSTYTGALDGFEDRVEIETFDPAVWARSLYDDAPLRMTFQASEPQAVESWQSELRIKLTELIGGIPPRDTPLWPQTLEVRDFPTYRREKFTLQSRPGLAALGYLLTPRDTPAPHRTMICLPGHGRGVDDIVGVDDRGGNRTDKDGYQRDFAIQCVEHGMAAVAIEQMAFGCRRDPQSKLKGLGASSCQPVAGSALLLGETMIAWRVYDVMRTIDWIETRDDLDSDRVGCMGISGGGTITTFAAALEPRIKAALISGYLNTFRDSIFSISHCIDNYVPGILQWCEMYDVAGLIAPRPLFVESGDKDDIFPVEASRDSFERVKKVYAVLDRSEFAEHQVFSGEHSFNGEAGLPFLAKHL